MRTAGGLRVHDITDHVQETVRESGVRDGIACVYSPHTCCIRITEPQNGFLDSFVDLLRQLPHDHYYAHDDWDKRTRTSAPRTSTSQRPSHCMAMLLGTAGESVPFVTASYCSASGSVLFLELDRERDRWLVQIVGS